MTETSFLRDIDWIHRHMPLTRRAVSALPDLTGVRLACNMHLDPKMHPFIHGLMEGGAAVHLTTCNTGTVSDPLV
ncbi:MAG: adenosylhomocysteinase, partial [Spirochaetes bacterium]|nr:adenosylhomocysteinase [Spirochaetota bacterium]